jgi:cytochrome c5
MRIPFTPTAVALHLTLSALMFLFAVLPSVVLPAQGQQLHTSKPAPNPTAQAVTNSTTDPGERKFEANCNRCHNAPQELSPRIVGTVIRHMRVRASLSAEDERDILRFLAP